jgi:hypothetical protein
MVVSLRPEPVNQDIPLAVFGVDNKVQPRKKKTNLWRGRTAATPNSPRSILTVAQQKECIDSYTNDGIMRRLVNILVMGIKGKRVGQVIKPNEELTIGLDDQELIKLNDSITKNDRVPDLQRNLIRINARVGFNEKLDMFLKSFFVTGRGLLEIKRFPAGEDFPIYGEPRALVPLNVINITNVIVNQSTFELDGIEYDDGDTTQRANPKRIIRPLSMLFGVNDDNNLYNNSMYSGVSPVWTCLSTSQSNLVINDEDIPEATRQVAQKFGFLYTGTNQPSHTAQIREQLANSTWLVHNNEKLKPEVYDLARDLTELPDVREMNSKYLTWSMMVPMFLIFEDTANFATASQALQAWKVTTIDYYRTVLQGILETYWYNPLIADHFGIDISDVITQKIKIKAEFEDLVFDTFKDKVDANCALVNASIFTDEFALENLGYDKFLQIKRELNEEIAAQKEEDIKAQQELLSKGESIVAEKAFNTKTNTIARNLQKNKFIP